MTERAHLCLCRGNCQTIPFLQLSSAESPINDYYNKFDTRTDVTAAIGMTLGPHLFCLDKKDLYKKPYGQCTGTRISSLLRPTTRNVCLVMPSSTLPAIPAPKHCADLLHDFTKCTNQYPIIRSSHALK
jgi:hypothetical protein